MPAETEAVEVPHSGRITLRMKLVAIGSAGIILTLVVMQAALAGLGRVDHDNRTLIRVRQAQRFHQDADMMHDALRAGVYNVVLASEGRSADPPDKAIREMERHVAQFEGDLDAIATINLSPRVAAVLSKVRPTEEGYIRTSRSLAALAGAGDRAGLAAGIRSFETLFDQIEVELADVTAVVARAADDAEADATHEAKQVQRQIVLASILALAGLLTLAAMLNGLGRQLAATLKKLVRSEQRSREFLAYAAHQLRTPISATRSSAEALLIEGGGTPQQENLLSNLVSETHRAGRLVADLLRMARLDQGEVPPAGPCNVVAMCKSEIARMEARNPTLDWRLRVDEPAPGQALLSGDAICEILANLLDNASRHAVARVTIAIGVRAGQLSITVEDDGPGLDEQARKSAFERFVSLDGRGGSGLGLPIGRALAQSQGGNLDYDGGRFVLELPYHPVRDEVLV